MPTPNPVPQRTASEHIAVRPTDCYSAFLILELTYIAQVGLRQCHSIQRECSSSIEAMSDGCPTMLAGGWYSPGGSPISAPAQPHRSAEAYNPPIVWRTRGRPRQMGTRMPIGRPRLGGAMGIGQPMSVRVPANQVPPTVRLMGLGQPISGEGWGGIREPHMHG